MDIYETDYTDEQRVPSAQLSPRSLNSSHGGTSTSNVGYPFGSPSVVSAGEEHVLGMDQAQLDSISHHQVLLFYIFLTRFKILIKIFLIGTQFS